MSMLALALLVLGVTPSQEAFDAGAAAYRAGDYAAAASNFALVAASDPGNAPVFYNLGNAFNGMGRPGPAVAAYERALQLDPALDAARQNRDKVLAQTKRNMAKPLPPDWEQALFFWAERIAAPRLFLTGLLLWTLFWAFLALRLVRPLPWHRLTAALLALVCLLFLGAAWAKSHPQRLAVASDDEVPVYFAKDSADSPRFLLHEGDRVLVERIDPEWVLVSTVGGERGWVSNGAMTLVESPQTAPVLRKEQPPSDTAQSVGNQKS